MKLGIRRAYRTVVEGLLVPSLILASLVVGGFFCTPGCSLSPPKFQAGIDSPGVQAGAVGADAVLSVVAPPFAKVGQALDAIDSKLTQIEADRKDQGKSQDAPLGPREWAEIGGSLIVGLLGLNQIRNAKYVKAAAAKPT